MSIRVTGMYSGLDTESIISELVSAQSVKKNSLVKAQTKLSWKQDAWKALNTKIYSFYTNTLSNMRYQASYMTKTTKVSNPNAINVLTGADAVDGVRTVRVNQLAKGAYLTSTQLSDNSAGVHFGGGASLAQLYKHRVTQNKNLNLTDAERQSLANGTLNGSFDVVGANGGKVTINVNENTTIDNIVSQIQKTGLNASFDQSNQRIYISSSDTGAVCNFNLVANNEGGMNALASLGLLSVSDLASAENKKWAAYQNDDGSYTDAFWDDMTAEITKRKNSILAANEAMEKQNTELAETNGKLADANTDLLDANTELLDALTDSDYIGSKFMTDNGKSLSGIIDSLYRDGGMYDQLQAARAAYNAVSDKEDDDQDKIDAKAALDAAQKAYDDTKAEAMDFINEVCYGPLQNVEVKDVNGNVHYQVTDAKGNTVYQQVADGNYYDIKGNVVYQKSGSDYVDNEGNVVDVTSFEYAKERAGGLNEEWEKANAEGNVPAAMQTQVDSLNKWYNAFTKAEENKTVITANESKIAANEAKIAANEAEIDANVQYIGADDDVDNMAMSKLEEQVGNEFAQKVASAKKALESAAEDSNNVYAQLATASKVDAQDAVISINGAKYTSMTNTFSVNGLTLTALEETDKDVTLTTSTDVDGIYDMIKNFLSEYNKLINEMDSLYNAESSKGYEPLTSEEKSALSDNEVEEWEKKIKDSLLRRDSTLSSISFDMLSVMLKGATVNGKQMYLSDFGINTLGYFKAAENERNAYHIDGDPDDADTKANDDVLKKMIATNPEAVRDFFVNLSNTMYDTLTSKMASTDYSSAFTVYNDKQLKKEYDGYKEKITAQEEKLNALMDKWYKKFSKMETAMAKLESRSSSLTSLFGS